MTTISLIIALLFMCSTGFCNAAKSLNESVKITELDGFTSLSSLKQVIMLLIQLYTLNIN